MSKFFKKLLRFIFPSKCLVCKTEKYAICPKCLKEIPNASPTQHGWIISVWSYKNPIIRKVLWMLKFENRFSVVDDLGQTLYDHLFDEIQELTVFKNINNYILVPIPLSKKSFRNRGYNQSEIIAKDLSYRSNKNLIVKNLLKKIKESPNQHSIKNRSDRLKNLKNVFAVTDVKKVKGQNIILIDDITTTNTTLIEAKRTLKKAGAKNVIAFTVAH